MGNYRRLIAGFSLLSATACVPDAITSPELSPEPLAEAAPAPESIILFFRCNSGIPAGSGEPLLIVDGVPWGGSREEAAALDIATIEVLTPEQLGTDFGARVSPAGVIIITTRGGTSGRAAQPVAGGDAGH